MKTYTEKATDTLKHIYIAIIMLVICLVFDNIYSAYFYIPLEIASISYIVYSLNYIRNMSKLFKELFLGLDGSIISYALTDEDKGIFLSVSSRAKDIFNITEGGPHTSDPGKGDQRVDVVANIGWDTYAETTYRWRDMWILSRAKRLMFKGSECILWISLDITPSYSRRLQLEEILDKINQGVISMDKDLNIINSNPEANTILYDANSYNPSSTLNFRWVCEYMFNTPIEELKSTKGAGTYKYTSKDNRTKYYEIQFTSIEEGSMENIAYIAYIYDITVREIISREYIIQNEYLEESSKVLAHDISSPMKIIGKQAGLLKRLVPADEGLVHKSIDYILESVSKSKSILNNIYKTTQTVRHEDKEQTDFEEVLDEVIKDITNNYPNCIITKNKTKFRLYSIRIGLYRVLYNLIDNALKHNDSHIKKIEVGRSKAGFYVKDNGVGIALKHQKTLFKEFKRLDSSVEGMGMGLKIIKSISELHGWRLGIDSEIGRGSTFKVLTS